MSARHKKKKKKFLVGTVYCSGDTLCGVFQEVCKEKPCQRSPLGTTVRIGELSFGPKPGGSRMLAYMATSGKSLSSSSSHTKTPKS